MSNVKGETSKQLSEAGMSESSRETSPIAVADRYGRPLKSLRLSVTDRCNLRCRYCMPEPDYVWLPREDLLSFEEMATLVGYFADLGVDKVRLTGGEPLLRRDLGRLVRLLRQDRRITEVALTTNGVLLAESADELYYAGLDRITVSLDTLKPERFRRLTGRDEFARVLEGLDSVGKTGFPNLKIDTVAIRGFNEDELGELIECAKRYQAEVRFIEYMDVGGANEWSMEKVLSQAMILEFLGRRYGSITALAERGAAPAQRFRLPDGTIFGIIPSTTTPFCSQCDRSRITADGLWYLCLYARSGVDLRRLLRMPECREQIRDVIRSGWAARHDRGAEEQKALERDGLRVGGLIEIDRLREDPHLEMHARGG
jgi:cyclic pyranopterin phosphate synthase